MEGWIKIHRHIKDHWIWKSDHRLKWWIDVLLTVNHADTKVLIKGNLFECKRGQSIRSLETWAKDWNVTKKTVKEFFELLQNDSMLLYEGIKISTRITVCNYDNYQEMVNIKETKGKRNVNGAETDATPKQEGEEGIKNDNKKEEIVKAWIKWKDYKKSEFRFSYKSNISEQAAKNELINLSENNAELAIKIIEQSIANGWKGFFKLKTNGNNKGSGGKGATPQELAELFAKKYGTDAKPV